MGTPGSGYEIKEKEDGSYRAVIKIESLKDNPRPGLSFTEGAQ
jgi:hypothetical protein